MKILFIDPEGYQLGLNTGIGYLAAVLMKRGYDVRVLDFNNNTKNKEERFMKNIIDSDVVCLSVKSFTIPGASHWARRAKKENPAILAICGGAHVTIEGVKFLKEHPEFDIGVYNEGEEVISEIISNYEKKDWGAIKGIVYNEKGKIHDNGRRERIKDLDSIPFPNYEVFDFEGKEKNKFPMDFYPIITSRGCPFNCVFCSVPYVMGDKKWYGRSPDNIVDELEQVKRKYDIKEFHIYDDNFTVNKERAKEFCRLLIKRKLNLKWACPNGIKANCLDMELVQLMKDSGCELIMIGVESGVPEVFKRIGKGGTLQDIEEAIRMIRKVGDIKIGGFFLVGLPGSTYKLDLKSLNYSKRLKLDMVFWSFLAPYPGTKFFEMVQNDPEYRWIRDWRDGRDLGTNPKIIFDTKNYSAKERIRMYHIANLKCKCYGAFINQNSSNLRKFYDILSVILKYDALYTPYHLFWAGMLFLNGLKRGTVKA